jgi:hypothetical protein
MKKLANEGSDASPMSSASCFMVVIAVLIPGTAC